jgi:conjugal transfer/entry exclusion protein
MKKEKGLEIKDVMGAWVPSRSGGGLELAERFRRNVIATANQDPSPSADQPEVVKKREFDWGKAIRHTLVIAALLMFGVPAKAQFGFSIVSDPATHLHLLATIKHEIEQIDQLRSQLNFWQQQAQGLRDMPSRYKAQFKPWATLSARDQYSNVSQLVGAANTGNDAVPGYAVATTPLVYRDLNGMPVDVRRRAQSRYGDVELADGSNRAGWELVGKIRSATLANKASIETLGDDSLLADATASQIAQKTNAAAALQVQQLNMLSQIQAAQLEQQILATQRMRNDQAQAFAVDAARGSGYGTEATSQAVAGMAEGLANFRFR